MVKNKLLMILIVSIFAFADAEPIIDAAKSESPPVNTGVSNVSTGINVNSKALSDADADWNTLNTLNRKKLIKQEEANLSTPPITAPGSSTVSLTGQTIATNIIINNDGYKSALLEFNDGSSLQVEVGSKVGKYVVREISMSGVDIAIQKCKKSNCKFTQNTLIKRAYPKQPLGPGQSLTSQSQQPTQVMNNSSNSDVVPPIVSNH